MADPHTLTSAAGLSLPGYLADALGALNVIVLHEFWGLNAQTRGVADRFAREGITAFAADLYGGKLAQDAREASTMMSAMDWSAAVAQIREAARALQTGRPEGRVGVLGFCMGGAVALSAATLVSELTACVTFYGIPAPAKADLSKLAGPVQGHFADTDDWITSERVTQLEGGLKAAGVKAELHRYPASHAFFNEARPEVYAREHADKAWERTVRFLKETLA